MRPVILWRATRAYSFPASVVPVLLGTVLAARGYGELHGGGHFSAWVFGVTLIGAVLAHAGANVLNDYFDFVHGVDTRPEHGSGVLTGGQMTAPQALVYALILIAGAGLCALFLLHTHAAIVLVLASIGLGCAVLYSAILKKYGVGDLLIVVAFGFGLTLGSYDVQTQLFDARRWSLVALFSVPICLLVDAILHANNMRDAADDRAAHVRTLATVLSVSGGRMLQRVLLFGPLVFVILGVLSRWLPIWSLVTLLTFPLLRRADRTGSVEGTAQTHLAFGLLYTGSLLLSSGAHA